MSLLVLNSSSRIANGLIRHLHKSGTYDQIVCADTFPNYWAVQKQLNFLHSVRNNNPKTKLIDSHIQDRPDLERAIDNATHILYVTHDVFENAPAKVSLIKNTATLVAARNTAPKSFISVTPNEHDHQGEPDAINTARHSEQQAQQISEHLVNIKSDLTFGQDSTVVNLLIQYLQSSQNIAHQPSGQSVAPIHTNCLAHAVEKALASGTKYAGKTFLAEGQKKITFNQIIQALEQATQSHAQLNKSSLERIVSPFTNNLASEFFLDSSYRNAVQYIKNYHPLSVEGALPLSELGVSPLDFSTYYQEKSFKNVDSQDQEIEHKVKSFLY